MRWSLRLLLFLYVALAGPASVQVFDLQRDGMPLAELNGQFRFHTGDDARWAEPSFDDSQWPLLRSDQSWNSQGYKNYSGFGWYRFSVKVPAGQKNLALLIPGIRDSYAVYANGDLIGQIGKFPPHPAVIEEHNQIFHIPPSSAGAGGTIVFAVRVWSSPSLAVSEGPGFRAAPVVGDSAAVARWADLQIHDNFWLWAQEEFVLIVNLAAAVLGFALFLVRRSEREYLWYCLAQVCWSIYHASLIATFFLSTPLVPEILGNALAALAGALLNLVFFHVLLRERRRVLFWVGAAPLCLGMVFAAATYLGLISYSVTNAVGALSFIPYTVAVAVLIVRAGLGGNGEAWLLAVPFTVSCMDIVYLLCNGAFNLGRKPAFATINNFLDAVFSWPVHLSAGSIIAVSCNLSVCAVLILRFARSRRDEERLSAELEAARVVQQVLIPDELPSVPGFQIESVYKPAGQVGGDFFQIIPLEAGGALIAIGDVSGKGMPAAMTVSLLVGTFRTLAHYTQSPGEILAAMNTRMLARSRGGFTTCLVLRLEANGAVVAANAGHIAPYIDGREIELINGLPLGLVSGADYTETVTSLTGRMVLVTDGVVEARNARGELFGFERTRELSTLAAEALAAAAQRFGQEDDITVFSVSLCAVAVPA